MPRAVLDEVRVEENRRKVTAPRTRTFVYVNEGFTGSVNSVASVNENRIVAPVTGVYREQYCVCARWPYTQRVLAIAVGVLLGALISLAVSIAFRGNDDPVLGPIFSSRRPVSD